VCLITKYFTLTTAENEKNEGNRLMKEEKYQEALAAYGR
jgi:hypothetical protein